MTPLKVVIDSNVLFRTLISGGKILNLIFNKNLKIFAPYKLKEEFLNNKKEILKKSEISETKFNTLTQLIFKRINFIQSKNYTNFIPKAKNLLGEHKKDKDFIALCLHKNIRLWTYESRFFKSNIAISTKQISKKLNSFQ